MFDTIRKIDAEAKSLGAAKGRTTLTGDTVERERIDRRLAILRARKAILMDLADLHLTRDEVAEVVATVKAVAA
jgi:hypothetical protein